MEWWGWASAGIGAVVLVAEGVKATKTLLTPVLKFEKRVTELEKHDKKDYDRFDAIDEKLKKQDEKIEDQIETQEKTNQALMKGMIAVINHMIDGNGISGLKEARENLLNHVIER